MNLFDYADANDPDAAGQQPEETAPVCAPETPDEPAPADAIVPADTITPVNLRDTVTTLAEALRAVEAIPGTAPGRLADCCSAVATTVCVTGRPPEQLAIAPRELVPLFKAVRPGLFRLKAKSWGNVRASLAGLAATVGWHASRERQRLKVTGAWAVLREGLPVSPQKANFSGFARYCQSEGVMPDQATEATIEGYRAWRATATYDLNPNVTIHGLRRIWNRHAGNTPGWPARKLAPPPDPRVFAFPLSAFPPSFVEDLEGVVEILRNPDPFKMPGARQLAANTWQDRRGHLIRAASILVRDGVLKIEEVTGLAVMVAPTAMTSILRHMHRKAGRARNGNAAEVANTLFHIARHWLKLDHVKLAELEQLRSVVKAGKCGVGKRSLRRLEAFDDPLVLKRFFRLPGELVKNGVEISAPVPDDLARRLAKHIRVHLPLLQGSRGGAWLFPGDTPAGHKDPQTLAKTITKEVERALGVAFNLHMVRHIAAMVLYDSSPDAGPVAQRLLAHRQLSTTETFYGRLKTRSAHRTWGNILDGMRTKERAKALGAKGPSRQGKRP